MPTRIFAIALIFFCGAALAFADAPTAPAALPILQKYITTMQNAQTLSVKIAQISTTGSVADPSALDHLRFVLVQPNRLKLTATVGTVTNILVSDGRKVRQWDNTHFAKAAAPSSLAEITPLMPMGLAANLVGPLLTNPREILAAGTFVDKGVVMLNGIPSHRLVSASEGTMLRLWMAEKTGLLLQFSVESGSRTYTLAFKDYQLNQAISSSVFALQPPKNRIAYISPQEPPDSALLRPGTPAPDFTLQTPDGKPVTLSSLKGKPVLIDFWATWCGPCQMAMPHIQKLHEELGDKVTVLSVNSWDQKSELEKWLPTHQQYTTTILFDPAQGDQSIATGKYKVSGIPTVYVIDKDGKVAATVVGYDPSGADPIKAALVKIGVQ